MFANKAWWHGTRAFLRATTIWAALCLALSLGYQFLSVNSETLPLNTWRVLHLILTSLGLFLSFSSVAGGIAASRYLRFTGVLSHGILLAFVVLVLSGYAGPVAEYRAFIHSGGDLESRFPTGAATMNGLLALHREVLQVPEGEHTFRGDADHLPPNWVTYLFHSKLAFALFAILGALLGQRIGILTSGVPPPTRWNAQWTMGLATVVVYFLAAAVAGDWVLQDQGQSGIHAAWLPLLVPLSEVLILQALLLRKPRKLPAPDGSPVE